MLSSDLGSRHGDVMASEAFFERRSVVVASRRPPLVRQFPSVRSPFHPLVALVGLRFRSRTRPSLPVTAITPGDVGGLRYHNGNSRCLNNPTKISLKAPP